MAQLQHDLKSEEFRMHDAVLYGWCVCGQWAYESRLLNREPMVRLFINHLESTKPTTLSVNPNEKGEWG